MIVRNGWPSYGIKQIKLQKVPTIVTKLRGTFGKTVSNAIKKEFETWKSTLHMLDSTSCNNGATSVACYFLQKVYVASLYSVPK